MKSAALTFPIHTNPLNRRLQKEEWSAKAVTDLIKPTQKVQTKAGTKNQA